MRVLAAALALVFAGTLAVWPSRPVNAQRVRATRVITYVPAVPSAPKRSGSCWTRSIAAPSRADAWRCMLGNEIYDPCFSAKPPGVVVCDVNPVTGGRGFAVRLTKPLPAGEPLFAARLALPWVVQLANGEVCVPLTGTHELIGKESIGYECSASRRARDNGAEMGLIDGSIVAGTVWHARLATFRIPRSGTLTGTVSVVPLAAVWR
ncbi:MAG TPA: hypothetical protein VK669_05575 [Candidatus Limnocylindrales bacterium]|nr:hypothetical protein [Candidatus Limnocylindrales bacterium]